MKSQTSKLVKALSIFSLCVYLTLFRNAYAQIICPENEAALADPHPAAILCPFARLLNIAVWLAGAAFVIMVLMTAYKYSTAQGDPKAMQGAKNTLTYAVYGLMVVIGLFSIALIAGNLLGVGGPIGSPNTPFNSLHDALMDFLTDSPIGGGLGITFR